MQIEYKNKNIEKICTHADAATKKYGPQMAEKIQMRIDQISAADSIEQMVNFNIGRCHLLKGNRSNQYAMDLIHPQRLIITKLDTEIQTTCIIEIVDYH